MPSLRAGDLQCRLPVACPQRSIGPAVQEQANEGHVSVERGLVERRMPARGAAAIDRTMPSPLRETARTSAPVSSSASAISRWPKYAAR